MTNLNSNSEKYGSINPDRLSDYTTEDIIRYVQEDTSATAGIMVIRECLKKENDNYRNGNNPRIEAKLLALIAYDLANATDFEGNPVRTKESPEQLKNSIIISEVTELRFELNSWFKEKKQQIQNEITTLEETITLLMAQVNPENKNEQLIEKLEALIESKKTLEFLLISEIVDLFYNLSQLMIIDIDNSILYDKWFKKICHCLGWTENEALALTVAKYHHRNFKKNGTNSFDSENELIGTIMNTVDNEDKSKIKFPTNAQLKSLNNLLEKMVEPEENKSIRQQINDILRNTMQQVAPKSKLNTPTEPISLRVHYENLKRKKIKEKGRKFFSRKLSKTQSA